MQPQRSAAKGHRYQVALRVGNGWYQTITKDMGDHGIYQKVKVPILSLG